MYAAFYGLRAKPFQLNPDPDFFFGSRGHRRAMAYLEYGLHQGEGFIVITGEVGAGKTTLLRNLLRRLPGQNIAAAQIVSTQVGPDDLLRLVASSFGLEPQGLDKSTLLQRLEAQLRALHAGGRRALLIVDEAQNLEPSAVEELRMLSNFQDGTRSLLQSFLVGQPEFREIMQRPGMRQLRQRVIASYHLGPLDEAETRAYVEHRLRHVGWRDDPTFADGALARIHALTDGVPRRINTLCDRVLLSAYLAERHAIDEALIREVAGELGDELGPSDARAEPVGHTSVRGPASTGPEAGIATLAASAAAARIAQLEARLAQLEAASATTHNVLQRVLRVLRAGGSASRRDEAPRTRTLRIHSQP
jgi:putative secretion ATPase (PEP-CTERM system associated)